MLDEEFNHLLYSVKNCVAVIGSTQDEVEQILNIPGIETIGPVQMDLIRQATGYDINFFDIAHYRLNHE